MVNSFIALVLVTAAFCYAIYSLGRVILISRRIRKRTVNFIVREENLQWGLLESYQFRSPASVGLKHVIDLYHVMRKFR